MQLGTKTKKPRKNLCSKTNPQPHESGTSRKMKLRTTPYDVFSKRSRWMVVKKFWKQHETISWHIWNHFWTNQNNPEEISVNKQKTIFESFQDRCSAILFRIHFHCFCFLVFCFFLDRIGNKRGRLRVSQWSLRTGSSRRLYARGEGLCNCSWALRRKGFGPEPMCRIAKRFRSGLSVADPRVPSLVPNTILKRYYPENSETNSETISWTQF